jgi:Tfp pilus assembly protein PilN
MRAVNLIPPEHRESGVSFTGRSGGAALMVVVLVLGLAVLAFLYGSAKHSQSKSKAELATVQSELSTIRTQVGRLAPYTSFIAMANQRTQYVSGLVQARFDWPHAFHELGRVLPRDASLISLHGQVGTGNGSSSSASSSSAASGATPTSATPPGSTPSLTLSGCATNQSEVAQTLQRLRLMDGVAEVALQSSVKSSSASGAAAPAGAAAAGSTGTCPPGAATFAAQVTFAGLPSAPPTNAPSSHGTSGSAAGASSAQQVSSRGGGR